MIGVEGGCTVYILDLLQGRALNLLQRLLIADDAGQQGIRNLLAIGRRLQQPRL
jgi:hypothetical protein